MERCWFDERPLMIVCLCNALTDRDVRDAAARGADRVSQVYRECGCRVDCGKCAGEVRDILRSPPRPPARLPAE